MPWDFETNVRIDADEILDQENKEKLLEDCIFSTINKGVTIR